MGMYTELVLKCSIRDDTPTDVIDVLNYLFADGGRPTTLPKHEFFGCNRWRFIGRCDSYYHHPATVNSFVENYLFSRSDLKNYDNEIAKFINWIVPYVAAEYRTCIGWVWYEEWDEPQLIIINEDKHEAD